MKRKLLSIFLAFAMSVSLLTVGASAVEPTYGDIAGHWAEASIERWSGHGIIQGNNGKFNPNGQLTCAHFAAILARLLKLPAAENAGFADNTPDAWHYDAINRCAAAGILKGNLNGTVTPNAPITRERAMVMLGRALGIEPIENPDLTKYTDAAQVASYAQGMLAALIEAGVVGGVTADQLAPQNNITRAATVTILDRAIGTYADKAGETINADGKGIVLVVADDVTVTGSVDKLLVPTNDIEVTVKGSENIDDITVSGDNSKVILDNASADNVTLDGEKSAVEAKNGAKIDNVIMSENAPGANVNAGNGTTIKNVENHAEDTSVTGNGTVKKVESNQDITVQTKDTDVKNSGDSKITVTDKNGKDSTVSGGSSSTTGSSSSSGGSSSGGGSSHSHSYADAWSYDDTYHWHAATCGHNVVSGKAEHTYGEDHKCTVCGSADPAQAAASINGKNYLTLQEAVAVGGEVKLLKDADISETVIVTKAVKLDLNGKTISNTNDLWEKRADDWSLLSVRAGGDLTITGNGTLKAKENDCYAVDVQDGATLTIENGTFVGNIHAVYVYQGELTVKGGAYSIQQKYPDTAKADEFVLNCYDKHRTEGTAKITVTGGTFVKFNPADCKAEGAGTNFVAAGYAAKKLEDDKYEVVALFDGGTGTAEDPFLIATSKQFKAIDQLNGAPYCFKQTADIAVAAGDEVTKFAGVYDGGNQELSSARTSGDFAVLFNVAGLSGHATFKNIHVTMGELATSLLSCVDWGTSYGADFENLTFTSTSELTKANSNNFGFVVINAIYTANGDPATYNFKDITVNVNLQNAGTCTGVLIGSGPCFNVSTTMNFINCTNNGTITGTSSVGFLYGNSAYIESLDESGTINVTNCTTNAVIKSTKDSADVAFAPGASKSQKADALNSYQQAGKYIVGNCLNGKTISVTQNAGADKFSIAIDDASGYTYKLVLNVAATYRTLDGEAWDEADVAKIPSNWDEAWNVSNGLKYLIALNKDASATEALKSFHAYDRRTAANKGIDTDALSYNEGGYAIVVKGGTNCIVFNTTEDTYIDSSVSVLVYAYSGNTLVGTKAI
ncbi:S-layer homology domain-containing protein [Dysosmobacter sp.]|uniref:S-layer homology domain-containing protein n=1 Tax=Dysosmobacter sp. TaxID=2591382 RepID=UPI003AF0FCE1